MMPPDNLAQKGDSFAAVGHELIGLCGEEDIFLYTEVGDGWVDMSIYIVQSNEIRWVDPAGDLDDRIFEACGQDPPENRWSAMIYEILGSKFTASVQYEDDLDPSEDVGVRRERALRERYGDRPIVYPDI